MFSRNEITGELVFEQVLTDGVGGVDLLYYPAEIDVGKDSGYVYVVSKEDHAVSTFERHPDTGLLTLVDVVQDEVNGIFGLELAKSIVVSPDNLPPTGPRRNVRIFPDRRRCRTGACTRPG